MKLFLSDRAFNSKKLTPLAQKTKDFLDKSKPGELLKTAQLQDAIGAGMDAFNRLGRFLTSYWYIHKYVKYWGSVATIKQLKKEVQKNAKRY